MKWVYRYRAKGLEPLIAAIILIAITLVIAIAVVAWMTGLFGTTVGGSEQLVVLPNATLYNSSNVWKLNVSVRNAGSTSSSVVAIYVGNYTCFSGTQAIQPGATYTFSDLTCSNNAQAFISGVRYTIKVVTVAGNTFYTEVIAS
ncbi:MAG: archaellin/type IV pilin N-terminal domain-containing protein [Sulfolobales archaeon]